MDLIKKECCMHGTAVLPINVGERAILFSGGKAIRTSRVVAVQEQTPERLCFETMNTHYIVNMSPFPLAAENLLPVGAAA